MPDLTLPVLKRLFDSYTEPEALFAALLPALCDMLQCDRCFLHVRNPSTRMFRVFCWRRRPELPDIATPGWEKEQEWEKADPMFAAALRTDPSIFVDDVETAKPEVLNLEFERQNFGHRALIHAHLSQAGQLWGVLQPCIFGQPRVWSEADRITVAQVIEKLKPIVIAYIKASGV